MESQPASKHLYELRNRLKHSSIVLIILSATGLYFSSDMLSWIQADLGFNLHALTAYEAFMTQITLGLLFGFFLSLPVLIYQMLKFAEPGLKPHEYRIVRNYLPFSILLFAAGAAFSYEFIVKKSLDFFMATTTSSGVQSVWSIKRTVGFALKLSAVTGVMFQLPIAALVLGKAGMIDSEMMKENRGYFIVGILLISALATPPDIVSQVLVTGPVIGLYQLSIFLVGRTSG